MAENYERLIEAEPDRFVRVDAEQPPETVQQRVVDIVREHLADP